MSRTALLLAALFVLSPAAVATADDPASTGVDAAKLPADQKPRYALFEQKCSKCHAASRATAAKFGASEWKRYMKRMIRRPNAGISEPEADEILEFLKFHSESQGL
jgi:cytochrome c5